MIRLKILLKPKRKKEKKGKKEKRKKRIQNNQSVLENIEGRGREPDLSYFFGYDSFWCVCVADCMCLFVRGVYRMASLIRFKFGRWAGTAQHLVRIVWMR